MNNFFRYPFELFYSSLEGLGKFFTLIFISFKSIVDWKENLSNILDQIIIIGLKSLPIVIFTSLFSGMVAGMQATYQFDIDTGIPTHLLGQTLKYLGSVIGTSALLELSPMVTALVMTGKIGATITAEIGTMRITEQIDALESISFNPISYLIMPRMIASLIMFPYLVIVGDILGLIGGLVASTSSYEPLTASMFFDGLKMNTNLVNDCIVGIIKGLFFGFAITSIACYKGFYTDGGAEGVGKSTTYTVVASCISIVILDYILAAVLL